MSEVPKIVRQRLGSAAASAHPDADLLTAFAEQSLTDRERGQVLAHLSQCIDCREVVSLAMPEIETLAVAANPRTSSWMKWPVLRWSALAACVVVVAAVGLNWRNQSRLASAPATH